MWWFSWSYAIVGVRRPVILSQTVVPGFTCQLYYCVCGNVTPLPAIYLSPSHPSFHLLAAITQTQVLLLA